MQVNDQLEKARMYERSLLSSIIQRPEIFESISLNSDDFIDPNNVRLFTAIKQLYDSGETIDVVAIRGLNQEITAIFLSEIITEASSPSNYEYYEKNVKRLSNLRKLSAVALGIHAKATDTDQDPEQLIQEMSTVANVFETKTDDVKDSKQAVDQVMEGIQKLIDNPLDVVGITTGFPTLDKHMSGLHNSGLIILAARPARGKSSFALQLAKNVAMYGKTPVMFFSLEMATDQLVQRVIASEAKVPLSAIRTGAIDNVQYEALKVAADTLSLVPILYNDKTSITPKDIRRHIRAYNSKNKDKIGFIVVDYLQLMVSSGRENIVQAVAEISRSLKIIAKEFNIPVLALSQLSRGVEQRGGKPRLADLRDSGAIEQDADIVMFLHSVDTQTNEFGMRDIELLIEKHRNGATFSVQFSFDGPKMIFTEVEPADKW